MDSADIVKNIMQSIFKLLPHITEEVGVDKIRQIAIKGYNSPSLPIYSYLSPEELQQYIENKEKIEIEKAEKEAKEMKGE